jgi:hypothetical protein
MNTNSAGNDKFKCSSHLLTPRRSCMTQCQVVQDFPDVSQVFLHKSNTMNLLFVGDAESAVPVHMNPTKFFLQNF